MYHIAVSSNRRQHEALPASVSVDKGRVVISIAAAGRIPVGNGSKAIQVSVITPAHDERRTLNELLDRLSRVLAKSAATFEIIIVDDGSGDGSAAELSRIAAEHPSLSIIQHPQRHGQSAAIQSGINVCRGDYVVIIDADLQDRPEDIPLLLAQLDAGCNFVATRRIRRSDSWLRRAPSAVANWLLRQLANSPVDDVGGMCAMRGDIARRLRLRSGDHRFLPILADHDGLIAQVDVVRQPRKAGTSHYGLSRVAPVIGFILQCMWHWICTHSSLRRPFRETGQRNITRRWSAAILLVVIATAGFLNFWNNDFPIWLHADEHKKVRFVLESRQDFLHPILLLQLTRLANLIPQFDRDLDVARLGRSVSAVAGIAVVAGIYVLLKRAVPDRFALLGAFLAAVCPTLAIHSHYFKEDMVFAACMVWALVFYLRFLDVPNIATAVSLGLFAGLAGASHYKSALLIPLLAVYPLLAPRNRATSDWLSWLRRVYALGMLAVVIATDVFAIVDYPLFGNTGVFLRGLQFEGTHSLDGHVGIRIFAGPQWYLYHWRYSVIPGMTLGLATVGLLSLLLSLSTWRLRGDTERLLALLSVAYYLVAEFSPSKPPPDECRYMIPVVIGLICFATLGIAECWSGFRKLRVALGPIVLALVGSAAYDTVQLLRNIDSDTRLSVLTHVDPGSSRVIFTKYTGEEDWWDPSVDDFLRGFVDYVVASSFDYDRYLFAESLRGQSDDVYKTASEYRRLFSYSYREIRPKYRSFAFSNPVVRIVDLRSGSSRAAVECRLVSTELE